MPSGWTRTNVGVETRHECVEPESIGSMAQLAIEEALREAKARATGRMPSQVADGLLEEHFTSGGGSFK
jgi:hypothetical protein